MPRIFCMFVASHTLPPRFQPDRYALPPLFFIFPLFSPRLLPDRRSSSPSAPRESIFLTLFQRFAAGNFVRGAVSCRLRKTRISQKVSRFVVRHIVDSPSDTCLSGYLSDYPQLLCRRIVRHDSFQRFAWRFAYDFATKTDGILIGY